MAGNAGLFLQAGGLYSQFNTLSSAVSGDLAERQMQRACLELEAETKRRAPVDTGNLRASYTSIVERQRGTVVGHVGTNVEYAPHQEFLGTSHLRPAFDAKRSRIVEILLDETLESALGAI